MPVVIDARDAAFVAVRESDAAADVVYAKKSPLLERASQRGNDVV